jgi:2-oxoglutarate dehydrogenase E2 component (dihydrolipoamide succinyltransferase)
MPIEVRAPTLPESVADATLVNWHKKAGDPVNRDENLVDLETDKVVLEVPAPQAGVLREVLKGEGETVVSQELIAVIEPQSAAKEGANGGERAVAAEPPPQAAQPSPEVAEMASDEEATPAEAEPPLSPAVRRLIAEHHLDPHQIPASGRGGRLTKEDVLKHLEQAQAPELSLKSTGSPAEKQTGKPAAEVPDISPHPSLAARPAAARPERRAPMTRLRARIAERLVQTQHTAAILTTMNEINMQAVMDLRRKYREAFEKSHGVRLGIMSFFVRACVEALRRFPVVNAAVDGADIVYHDYYDIGIAVDSPRGLVVPVLRDADRLGFAEVEKGIAVFGRKAREGSLSLGDLSGGTFTITNGGVFGSLISTPILNPPQSAILGMHKIQDRPVVEEGQIRARPMMYVALSYDHRIIDGRDAVQFLVAVKEALEEPARLLLQL